MSISLLLSALGIVVACSILIMLASNPFEDASGYLGRRMPPGVRGASIEAIASSMPELLTTVAFLFWLHPGDKAQADTYYSAAIATCAGSAVFNAVIIPACCVLAVMFKGVKIDGVRQSVKSIEVKKSTVIRDGLVFVLAEILLIVFLGSTKLFWWMGGCLMLVYLGYVGILYTQFRRGLIEDDDDDPDDDDDDDEHPGLVKALFTLDFNRVFFSGRAFTTGSAWVVLIAATAVLAAACWALAHGVIMAADALQVPPYFTAVILAAAATSVPDTVISVRDALKGDYDDAVANAVGSNIFDICVALGLPLMVYGLIHGVVTIEASSAQAADVQQLRIALIFVTAIMLGVFLVGPTIGLGKAVLMIVVYLGWTAFVIARAVMGPDDTPPKTGQVTVSAPAVVAAGLPPPTRPR